MAIKLSITILMNLCLYSSYFKLYVLAALAHPIHIVIYAPGDSLTAAFKQLELFWVYQNFTLNCSKLFTGIEYQPSGKT